MAKALEIRDLTTAFDIAGRELVAVNKVSFSLAPGKILALVGESGSGKSLTGLSVIGLVDPPGRISGEVLWDGRNVLTMSEEERRQIRGAHIAMIFQDPMMTLNPVLRIDTQMIEAVRAHSRASRAEAWQRSRDALGMVGIPSPEARLSCYPHELSGGMRQRVAIAIALLHRPAVVIADEPTTALDVTIQAQILSEVQNLAQAFNTAFLWITHDLAIASGLSDDIAVMYAGRIVERGATAEVLAAPRHPYTRGLIDCIPSRNTKGGLLHQIPGMVPTLAKMPVGCAFRARCRNVLDQCAQAVPEDAVDGGRSVRCFNPITEIA